MKTYLKTIAIVQDLMLGISIMILALLPGMIVLNPSSINIVTLYALAQGSLFLVMSVRPLADLLPKVRIIRPLVILRKGFGVFSASIVISFMLAKLIADPVAFFGAFGTAAYWSLNRLALFAHLSDIAAILLLVTSNKLSKRLLGPNWKRLQRASYIYFYGSSLYIIFVLHEYFNLFYLVTVTGLTYFAFLANRQRRRQTAVARTHTSKRPLQTVVQQ